MGANGQGNGRRKCRGMVKKMARERGEGNGTTPRGVNGKGSERRKYRGMVKNVATESGGWWKRKRHKILPHNGKGSGTIGWVREIIALICKRRLSGIQAHFQEHPNQNQVSK